MNKAVFFDRDGTINEEVGYLTDLDKLRLIPGSGAAIKRLNEAGFKVVVVTNQAGVARGYFTESFVLETHKRFMQMLRDAGARLDGIYYCPHHPTAGNSSYTMVCDCRKPGTGLIDRAARDLDIDADRSYVVGDKWSDVELGQRAGAHTILVRTGFATDDPGNIRAPHVADPDFIAHDITEAVDWIVQQQAISDKK
jgi:D-glycero-D-manno-heptose 1,7-bisphosphate phosphatase